MNKIYRLIWSEVRNCYVAVSELAKRHTKNGRAAVFDAVVTPRRLAAVTLSVLLVGMGASPVWAKPANDIVRQGTVAYDISPGNEGVNIAVGENAKVFIGGGNQEAVISFGETVGWTGGFFSTMHIHSNDNAKKNLPEGIAVGTNAYARTGSIDVGGRTLNSIAIGDTTANNLQRFGVGATTLGTNSYTGGSFATTIGSYNVQSSNYDGSGGLNTLLASGKNAMSTVIGSFNSNESYTGGSYSGVSNVIAGAVNKVTNSNGAIVIGAGNTVKNSSQTLSSLDSSLNKNFASVTELQDSLISGVVASKSGGATLVLGGGNVATSNLRTQIMGVNNTVSNADTSFVDGYYNVVNRTKNTTVIGSNNVVNANANSNILLGDNRTLAAGKTNNVIVGPATAALTTNASRVVALGNNTDAQKDGSVALGSLSVADRAAGEYGSAAGAYDASGANQIHAASPAGGNDAVWTSTQGALSVGGVVNGTQQTRQITNVAAGSEDSDAVNVAQLKAAQTEVVAGTNIGIIEDTSSGHTVYTVNAPEYSVEKSASGSDTKYTIKGTLQESDGNGGVTTREITVGEVVDTNTVTTVAGSDYVKVTDSGTGGDHSYKVEIDTDALKNEVNTDTTYTITTEAGTGNVVNTYTVTDSNQQQIGQLVDTDTDTVTTVTAGDFAKVTAVIDPDGNRNYTVAGAEVKGSGPVDVTYDAAANTFTVAASGLADTNLTNITNAGETVIKNIASDAVKVDAGENITVVSSKDAGGRVTYTVSAEGRGTVASGDKGLVSGDTVYNETRVSQDGRYVKQGNTAAENLSALDAQVAQNTTNITNTSQEIHNMGGRIDRLGTRINKVGAGAAALAQLHPLDFDPDDKLSFAGGFGNYRSEKAAAIGAFYRPTENIVLSVSGTVGNSDNMVGAGISFNLDGKAHNTNSKTAMAKEILELKQQVAQLTEAVQILVGNREAVMFPDVPENHWAYEYIEDLQKKGVLEGYPDGDFKGDRSMTRYEFAAMLDRALRNGVALSDRIMQEFSPELSRFRVDRVYGDDSNRHKIERVRVNDKGRKERDMYGSKI